MVHSNELGEFLKKYININGDRLNQATGKVNPTDGSLIMFLKTNLGANFLSSSYQGSFAYHTIIKPKSDKETGSYDVDVAIKLKTIKEYEGQEYKYHLLLINCFKLSDRYKDKLDESKERSVRIQYDTNDGEFHVDLVPMFHDGTNWNVIDRKYNTIEISGGNEFRDWVNSQNNKTSTDSSKAKYLKEVIRIYKYLRNETSPDLIRSVQLTLLLSRQVDKLDDDYFIDLSTTLYGISKELNNELSEIDSLADLDLANPGLEDEIFERNISEASFQEFKNWVYTINEKIENAYFEENETESIQKWQEIFGEKFAFKAISNSVSILNYSHAQKISDKGWVRATIISEIQIIGFKIPKYNTSNQISINSGEGVPNSMYYRIYALLKEDLGENRISWQITNEDNRYVMNKRGQIGNESKNLGYDSSRKGYGIQEEGRWKGKHWVKCYLINKYDQVIGESPEFLVNIMQ